MEEYYEILTPKAITNSSEHYTWTLKKKSFKHYPKMRLQITLARGKVLGYSILRSTSPPPN